jgi:hypothetical protein
VYEYDELVVAAGAGQSYFGNDRFAEFAPGMKSIDDALELRGRIFGAFELAELATDQAEIDRLMTFVVVGAGPPVSRWPGRSPSSPTARCGRTSGGSTRRPPGSSCSTRPPPCCPRSARSSVAALAGT